MHFRNRNKIVTFQNFGTQTANIIHAWHKKGCSVGILKCTQKPSLAAKSQNDLNYYLVQKHITPKSDITFKFKICYE